MSKNNNSNLISKLLFAKKNGGHITFIFADDTKQTQAINPKMFFDHNNKSLDLNKVVQKINDICHDLKAIRFEI